MADTYTPGLQFQDWTKLPSLTGDAFSTMLTAMIAGPLIAGAKSIKGAVSPEESNSAPPSIPQANQQNWQNIPNPQLGVAPVSEPGLNPNMIGQSPFGIKPVGMVPPPSMNQQTASNLSLMDPNKIKQSVWE
jgi:hypothetical protein